MPDINATIIVTDDTKEQALQKIDERLKELDIKYETSERQVTFTEIKVTLKLNTMKAIKHLFNLVKAPEEEIKYLCKVKSIVEATARDILTQVLQSIKG